MCQSIQAHSRAKAQPLDVPLWPTFRSLLAVSRLKLSSTGSHPAKCSERSVLPCSVHPHDATSARLCPTDNGLFERPAAALAYLPAHTAHTVANTQRVGPQAKPFRTDGAAALGATAAASTKLCAAATKPAAGTATRGSLPTILQQ